MTAFVTRKELATLIKVANRTFDWEEFLALDMNVRAAQPVYWLMVRQFVVMSERTITDKGRRILSGDLPMEIADDILPGVDHGWG